MEFLILLSDSETFHASSEEIQFYLIPHRLQRLRNKVELDNWVQRILNTHLLPP